MTEKNIGGTVHETGPEHEEIEAVEVQDDEIGEPPKPELPIYTYHAIRELVNSHGLKNILEALAEVCLARERVAMSIGAADAYGKDAMLLMKTRNQVRTLFGRGYCDLNREGFDALA